jgi:broad specificity phosphatase PhoE
MVEKYEAAKEMLVYWVRHGERADDVGREIDIQFKWDPPITEEGKKQGWQAGLDLITFIKNQGH